MKYAFAFMSALVGAPVCAETYAPVKDLPTFLQLVEGRDLRIGLYDLTLQVLPDGQISGSALGWGITGAWRWKDGYFCRNMDWSGYEIPENCQLVEALGAEKLRFTVDKGAGKSATFKLQ